VGWRHTVLLGHFVKMEMGIEIIWISSRVDLEYVV
jgi:hypothetical protein